MRLTRYSETEWTPRAGGRPGPAGATRRPTEIKLLHVGDPGKPGNFEMVVARYPAPREYPVHRHNIDQLRYTLVGSSPWAPGRETPEGSLVYIPSGTHYGPYVRQAGIELMAVQFEGPSRAPFSGDESSQAGPFPEPRFTTAIEMHPAAFAWIDVAAGVQLKELGTFSERQVRIAHLAVEGGALYDLTVDQACLLFVTSGSGQIDGHEIESRDGVRLDSGESVAIGATSRVEILLLGLPKQPVGPDTR
jgi:hypothetical protein